MNKKFKLLIGFFIYLCLLHINPDFRNSPNLLAAEQKNKLFTKLLHLGKEDSKFQNSNEIFAVVNDITFDLSGNIIIVDTRMKNIRKFNLDGELLLEYSQVGNGPGEIKEPWLIESMGNLIYVFDVANSKIITFTNNFKFEKEVIITNSLQDMILSKSGNLYVAGLIFENKNLTKNYPIHIFDQTGKKKRSFGKEIKLNISNISNSLSRMMVYRYYAGKIFLHISNNRLLASPVFDNNTFVYDLNGQFLYRFKNPDFKYKLLNYTVSKKGVTYSLFETQSGPAFGLSDKYIIKSYQVSYKKGHLEHFIDIFDWQGNVIQSQIPINGVVMDVSSEGLLVTTNPYPYTQIWVYRLNFDQIEN